MFVEEKFQPSLQLPTAAHSEEAKTIDEEKDAELEDEAKTKQRNPITILSEDEE